MSMILYIIKKKFLESSAEVILTIIKEKNLHNDLNIRPNKQRKSNYM